MAKTIKEAGKVRFVRKIMHNLIKGNMLSHLDGLGNGVKVENVSLGKTMVPKDAALITGEMCKHKIIRRRSRDQGSKMRRGRWCGSRAARRISSRGREVHKGNIKLTAKAMEVEHLVSNRRARGRCRRRTGGVR
jgi:hypothetical protein